LRILRSLKCDEVEEPMDNELPFRGREAEIPSQQFPTINSSFYYRMIFNILFNKLLIVSAIEVKIFLVHAMIEGQLS
jgi:hypothetical protein